MERVGDKANRLFVANFLSLYAYSSYLICIKVWQSFSVYQKLNSILEKIIVEILIQMKQQRQENHFHVLSKQRMLLLLFELFFGKKDCKIPNSCGFNLILTKER